jgi:phosphatidylglycerophosphatase C
VVRTRRRFDIKAKVAIFDFCGTCVDMQTGDAFLLDLLRRNNNRSKYLLGWILSTRLAKKITKRVNASFNLKSYLIALTRGIPAETINTTATSFSDYLRSKSSPQILEHMNQANRDGLTVIVISAGFQEYISVFFKSHQWSLILANELEILDGLSTGQMKGHDCYGAEKVRRLLELYPMGIDPIESRVYSDCISDMPIFDLACHHRYLVSLTPDSSSVNAKIKKLPELIKCD